MAAQAVPGAPVLKGVVAYVEVWSANGTENYSKTFASQLEDMGAKVSKTLNKQVTHVVFKDGYPSTWEKARRRGAKLVSVLWVERCRTEAMHVDEALFPAADTSEHLPCLARKKRKCMQPKDFVTKTPENDKRLQKKFEKMAKELQKQKTSADEVLLFEANGSLMYSPSVPAGGHRLAMEKRLQEMKDGQESLCPASSQLTEVSQNGPASLPHSVSSGSPHRAPCSDASLARDLRSSFEDLCGTARGSWEKEVGAGAAGRAAYTPEAHPGPAPASPGPGRQPTPGGSPPDPGQARGHRRSGPPEQDWATPRAAPGRPQARSAKRKRTPENLPSPPEEKPSRRGGRWWRLTKVQLFPPERSPGAPGHNSADSSFDDYFSPANLRERGAEVPPAAGLGRRNLSKRERTSVLRRSDFSRIGKAPRPGGIPGPTATRHPGPQSPPDGGQGSAERPACPGLAAAQEAAGRPPPAGPRGGADGHPDCEDTPVCQEPRAAKHPGEGTPQQSPEEARGVSALSDQPRQQLKLPEGGLQLGPAGDLNAQGSTERQQRERLRGGAPGST